MNPGRALQSRIQQPNSGEPESDGHDCAGQPANSAAVAAALLFLLSMGTLALQIVQIRVFSYSINPVFVYMVISMALLGIGASGTALSLLPGLRRLPLVPAMAGCLILFALTGTFANLAFARLSSHIDAASGLTLLSPVTGIFVLFTLPYFFSGMGVALLLLSDRKNLGRNYFINLAGNGAGCFVVYPFLPDLGAPGVVMTIFAACGIGAAIACWTHVRRVAWLASAAAFLLAACIPFAKTLFPYQPDSSDFYQATVDKLVGEGPGLAKPIVRYSRWDPVGRIEIFEFPDEGGRFSGDTRALLFAQDSGAPSVLLNVGQVPATAELLAESSLYGIATTLRSGGDVLVMGLGGGPDLIASWQAGAGRLTGIEINHAVLRALGEDFREYLGLPAPEDRRFELVHADGRAFARRFLDRFDVIQMTGADTYAAGSISGSILSENYLYTVEAFRDYFNALKDDGILAVTRFGLEPLKIVTTASTALRDGGATEPSKHFVIVKQGDLWVLTLIKKQPFLEHEIALIRQFVDGAQARQPDFSLPVFDVMGFTLNKSMSLIYDPGLASDQSPRDRGGILGDMMRAADSDQLVEFMAMQENFNWTPSTDDKPFFLQMNRMKWPSLADLFAKNKINNPFAWSIHNYLSIVVQVGIIALVLILGPLVVLRTRGAALAASAPVAVYFFAIGAGFMFVEIGLMQQLSLFLGHPNYSISTVLFSLLLFSGIGSFLSSRWKLGIQVTLGMATAAIMLGVLLFGALSGRVFDALLVSPISLRISATVLMLAPISFFMGMPLPNMLTLVEKQMPDFSPWALGVNGFASVMGSLATIPLTASIGFSSTFQLGAAAYVVAWLSLQVYLRMNPSREAPA